MYGFISALILIAALLLIGVVLIQKSKGGGLASNFNSANQVAGVRKTTDFIEKATWTLAIFICVLSIVTAFIAPNDLVTKTAKVQATQTEEKQATPFQTQAAETPATPAPANQAPAE